jgi:hypothetical protein
MASNRVLHKLGIVPGIQHFPDSVLMKGNRFLAHAQGVRHLLHRLPLG